MTTPTTLLDGALKSGQAILVYGANPPTAEILAAATGAWAEPNLLDLRDAASAPKNGSLRRTVAEKLRERPALVVLVGAEVPDPVREVLAEVIAGQLNLPGEVRRLEETTRLLVVAPVERPAAALDGLFALRLPAARALGKGAR